MATRKGIELKYLKLHDKLTDRFYRKHELGYEEFDQQHGKIWNDLNQELKDRGFILPEEPVRDLAAEIDSLRARVKKIEAL